MSRVRGSRTLLGRPGVIQGSLLHSQSPSARRPLYLRSEPLCLASPRTHRRGCCRARSALAPKTPAGSPRDRRRGTPRRAARCFLPGTPTSRRGVRAPPRCSGGAQTMPNEIRRADAASKRDAPSLHTGQGLPGAGRLLRCERREGRGFQRRGDHAGWTHGEERAAGPGSGQGALQARVGERGREPRGTPVLCTEGRRGARRRPTPLGPLSRGRCIALLGSQPAAAPRVLKKRVGQGRETKVLTSALVSQPPSGAAESTVPSALDFAGFIALTLAKMLALASLLFVMAVALCLPVCSVTAVGR